MNQKLSLSSEEIKLLGITHETIGNRYRLTPQQIEQVYEYRGLREDNSHGIVDACKNVGVSPKDVKMIWLKTKSESVRVENPYYEEKQEREVIDILDNFLAKFEPLLKPVEPRVVIEKQLGLFDRLVLPTLILE